MHIRNMNTRKQQSELIFASLFLQSQKHFFFCLPIFNLANTEGFPAAHNRLFLKTYGVKRKAIIQDSFQ